MRALVLLLVLLLSACRNTPETTRMTREDSVAFLLQKLEGTRQNNLVLSQEIETIRDSITETLERGYNRLDTVERNMIFLMDDARVLGDSTRIRELRSDSSKLSELRGRMDSLALANNLEPRRRQ